MWWWTDNAERKQTPKDPQSDGDMRRLAPHVVYEKCGAPRSRSPATAVCRHSGHDAAPDVLRYVHCRVRARPHIPLRLTIVTFSLYRVPLSRFQSRCYLSTQKTLLTP